MSSATPGGIRAVDALGLWLLAATASAVVGTHGLVYWDAGDYVRLALDGGQSGLLLGRPLFLLASRLVLATGVEPAHAEPVLRWFWTMVGATAAPALAGLASCLGLDRRASLVAGATLALSPAFAHSAHQVLTDAPALALSIAAVIAAARSQAVAAGLLMAAAIATRETAGVHVVAMALLLGRRAVLALTVTAIGVVTLIIVFPAPAIDQWMAAMSRSVEAHPINLAEIAMSISWTLVAGPVPILVGAIVLARGAGGNRLRHVAIPAALATVLLLFYPDASFSPRYMLATVPFAFFLAAAPRLAVHPGLLAVALLVPLAAVPFATRPARALAGHGAALTERLAQLPARTLVVPGHFCAHARLASTVLGRRDFDMVCPGWDWPTDLAGVLDAALAAGRPVAVDVANEAWMSKREGPARDAVREWAARHENREVAGFLIVLR